MKRVLSFVLLLMLLVSAASAGSAGEAYSKAFKAMDKETLLLCYKLIRDEFISRKVDPDATTAPTYISDEEKGVADEPSGDVVFTAIRKDLSNSYSISLDLILGFKNNTKHVVDAYDFTILLYDTYGEKISAYGIGYTYTSSYTSSGFNLAPGELRLSKVSLLGFGPARYAEVWVTRYHTADGQTKRLSTPENLKKISF